MRQAQHHISPGATAAATTALLPPPCTDEGEDEEDDDEEAGDSDDDGDEAAAADDDGSGSRSRRKQRRRQQRRVDAEIIRINRRTNNAAVHEAERLDAPEEMPNAKPMMELDPGSNVWYQAYVLKESINEAKVRFPRESGTVLVEPFLLG